MEEVEVHLGLGSNLGDRMDNLLRGLRALGNRITLTKVSSIYETEPWGYKEQPPFLNCVCEGVTSLSPESLLNVLKETEESVGRRPTFPGGPRVFDADLLFYGQLVMRKPHLEVPHPRITERAFVLAPLSEIAINLVHPSNGRMIQELLAQVEGREGVRLWAPPPTCVLSLAKQRC